MGAFLGCLTALTIGISDIFGRRVSVASSAVTAAGVMQAVAAITSLGATLIISSEWIGGDVALGAVSGVGMAVGLGCYYAGITRAGSALVAPLVATLSAVVPYLYTLVRGVSPSLPALVGALVALGGLVLITTGGSSTDTTRTALTWGLASGLGYGMGLTVVIETSSDSGAWPAVSQRVTASAVMLVVAAVLHAPRVPPAGVRVASSAAGALAGLTTIFYIAGVQMDAQPAVVTASMFPAASVLGGWLVYGDDVRRWQALGIAAVLLGVAGVVVG